MGLARNVKVEDDCNAWDGGTCCRKNFSDLDAQRENHFAFGAGDSRMGGEAVDQFYR